MIRHQKIQQELAFQTDPIERNFDQLSPTEQKIQKLGNANRWAIERQLLGAAIVGQTHGLPKDKVDLCTALAQQMFDRFLNNVELAEELEDLKIRVSEHANLPHEVKIASSQISRDIQARASKNRNIAKGRKVK